MQPAFRPVIIALTALLAHFAVGCGRSSNPPSVRSEFSPDRWPQHDRDRYLALQGLSYSDAPKRLQKFAVSSKGMVAGTSDPFAIHAGLEILKHGGSAADAALTTALTQVALTAGSTISYAGTMTVVYYEVISLGSPNIGGLHTLAALKLAEVADLKRQGPYATSPEALYSLIQISRLQCILALTLTPHPQPAACPQVC